MRTSANKHEENTIERIERDGHAAELLRAEIVEQLGGYNAAFYEHGGIYDLMGMRTAFAHLESRRRAHESTCKAVLIEEIVALFGPAAVEKKRLRLRQEKGIRD